MEIFLRILWEGGMNGLWSQDAMNNGIIFHCQDNFTAWFSGCEYYFEPVSGPAHAPEREQKLFAPYGKVVELTIDDEEIMVISTQMGPLEICSYGRAYFPSGEIEDLEEGFEDIKSMFKFMWEKSYKDMDIDIVNYVSYKIRY